ncbi:hypothetical protein [Mesorhizobium sp. STM 4661]|uniref:hypothetical protein n=1 Tax=Mesorhizobium sp. STM 4661 TaxID=1297570 RepID=UPI0002BE532F|nr:hypothetical protein [Mesorhizobium sp. STM 4661]CCV14367.1 conserved hypothetical protein [Mesorhizobium sp. STM 4661]
MATQNGQPRKHSAASAVVRRFPQFELTIHRLMDRNDSFRDMCEELADAEFALSRVELVAPELREARRTEWQELVDRLIGEVGAVVLESEAARRAGFNPGSQR